MGARSIVSMLKDTQFQQQIEKILNVNYHTNNLKTIIKGAENFMNYQMLVNKDHKIDDQVLKNEIIPNIVAIETIKNNKMIFETFGIDDNTTYLEKKTAEKFKEFQNFAKENGIIIDVSSGYLSLKQQGKKYDYFVKKKGKEWADISSCLPGYSEHNTGLAMDFDIFLNGKWSGIALDENGNTNPTTDWLHTQLHKFGFILRYPKGKENITKMKFEPWHIRYVGEDLAKYLYENNLTLEEYYLQSDNKSNDDLKST